MSEQDELKPEVKKLTSWKNAPELKDLKDDMNAAKPIHDSQKTKVAEYQDNLNITGKAKIKVSEGNSAVQPKLIRKQAEWRYASLSEPFLSTEDLFNVSPVTWEDREAAIQNQYVLNHQFNTQLNKTRFIDEYVRAAVDEGTVIVRTGWEFHEEEYDKDQPVVQYIVDDAFAPTIQHLDSMKAESPSQYATDVPEELKQAHELSLEQGRPIRPEITGYETVKAMRTVYNRPTAEVCASDNVMFDPTCLGDVEKAGFAIYSFESSKAELKKDGKYKNLDSIVFSSKGVLAEPDHKPNDESKNFNYSDDARKKVVVYEYWGWWDINDDDVLVPIVAAWIGDTLIRLEENPYPDKSLPFVVSQYLPVRRSMYGEPDGALLEDNQKILGAVTRGMIDIMGRSANGQMGISKTFLDATNRRKFDQGRDYEFNPNADPRTHTHMHTFPEIPQSAQFIVGLMNQEAESMTGVKSYSSGVSGASLGDVAAGVRGALDAASKRELGILRRLSAGIVKIGRKFISMNAEFLSEEEIVRITNDEFVTIRRDDLSGNFDLKLSISTAEEDNNKAEQLAFLLQTTGNTMDPAMMKMILSDIARLRKMPDMAKKIESYEPQPDPMAVKKAELEVALLEAQIAREQAETNEANARAQLNTAKVDTEIATTGKTQAETDKTNLDFVEQESGVKQERDLQKAGEQGRVNMQLKQMDVAAKEKAQKVDLVKEYIKGQAKNSK